jgi:hypothetical protein
VLEVLELSKKDIMQNKICLILNKCDIISYPKFYPTPFHVYLLAIHYFLINI